MPWPLSFLVTKLLVLLLCTTVAFCFTWRSLLNSLKVACSAFGAMLRDKSDKTDQVLEAKALLKYDNMRLKAMQALFFFYAVHGVFNELSTVQFGSDTGSEWHEKYHRCGGREILRTASVLDGGMTLCCLFLALFCRKLQRRQISAVIVLVITMNTGTMWLEHPRGALISEFLNGYQGRNWIFIGTTLATLRSADYLACATSTVAIYIISRYINFGLERIHDIRVESVGDPCFPPRFQTTDMKALEHVEFCSCNTENFRRGASVCLVGFIVLCSLNMFFQHVLYTTTKNALQLQSLGDLRSAVDIILGRLCDSVVHLNDKLEVLQPTTTLKAMLHTSRELEGDQITRHIRFSDRDRFIEGLRSGGGQGANDDMTPQVSFVDAMGILVHTRTYHTKFLDVDDKPRYVIGICEASDPTDENVQPLQSEVSHMSLAQWRGSLPHSINDVERLPDVSKFEILSDSASSASQSVSESSENPSELGVSSAPPATPVFLLASDKPMKVLKANSAASVLCFTNRARKYFMNVLDKRGERAFLTWMTAKTDAIRAGRVVLPHFDSYKLTWMKGSRVKRLRSSSKGKNGQRVQRECCPVHLVRLEVLFPCDDGSRPALGTASCPTCYIVVRKGAGLPAPSSNGSSGKLSEGSDTKSMSEQGELPDQPTPDEEPDLSDASAILEELPDAHSAVESRPAFDQRVCPTPVDGEALGASIAADIAITQPRHRQIHL